MSHEQNPGWLGYVVDYTYYFISSYIDVIKGLQ